MCINLRFWKIREKKIFLKVFGLNYIIKVIGQVLRCVERRFNVLLLETQLKLHRANGFSNEVELEFKQMFLCCPNFGCAPKFKVIK
jgi:hypothetical protein